jgi:hypothetical protein
MFYEEKEVDELLKCPQCQQRLVEPRNIPCGVSVCTNCVEKLIENELSNLKEKFKCFYCNEEHEIPKKGFPLSMHLKKLLEKEPNEVYRGKLAEELKTQLKTINAQYQDMDLSLTNGLEKIKERCSLLKHQIQIKAKSQIEQINKLSNEMQHEVDDYEKECIESFEKSVETKEKMKQELSKVKSFCESSSKYLIQFKIDDDKVSSLTSR